MSWPQRHRGTEKSFFLIRNKEQSSLWLRASVANPKGDER